MAKKTDHDDAEEFDDDLDTGVDDEDQDETDEDEDDSNDDDNEETGDEDEDDSEQEGGSESFKKRFTQFKGGTPTKYAKNLEDAYYKSTTEAVRLAKENRELKPVVERIQALIATNPELAKQLGTAVAPAKTETPASALDPDIAWAKGERQRQWTKEIGEFKQLHPELESDPGLADELNEELAIVAEVFQRKHGYGISMAEGLRKAWSSLGHDNVSDKKERIAIAAKAGGSKSKSASGKQSAPKIKLSEKQIEVAQEMMQISRQEAIKRLSTYAK